MLLIMSSFVRKRLFCLLYTNGTLSSTLVKRSNQLLRVQYANLMVQRNKGYSKPYAFNEGPFPSRFHPKPAVEMAEEDFNTLLSKKVSLNNEEWDDMKNEFLTEWAFITEETFCSITMNSLLELNKLNLAHSFLKYLEQSNIKPNFVTYLKYISLCARNHRSVDQELILKTFENIQELIDKSLILDQKSMLYVVEGLCATRKWRDSFEYLKKLPQKPSVEIYSAIACAAIRNNDDKLAWEILTCCIKTGEIPSDKVIEEFLLVALELQKNKPIEANYLIKKLFQYMEIKDIIISYNNAKLIEQYFVCHRSKWLTSYTKINRMGVCENCDESLKFSELTDREFNILKNAFLEKVVKKSDVFINSTEIEFNRYINFIEQNKPFHVVLDGLNVAHSFPHAKSRTNLAFHLLKIVKSLRGRSKRLLILGRKHMRNWTPYALEKIAEKAKIFYTDNISQDDPFVIYAALASGPHTLFLSGDLMRDHTSRLEDPKIIQLFKTWQLSHQIFLKVDKDTDFKFVEPVRHRIAIQGSNDDGWHIPYDDKILLDPYEELNNWLCIQRDLS